MLSKATGGVTLRVKLTPGAARNALVRTEQDDAGNALLRATVTTVPEKGKANAALIKMLAKKLGLPKTSIRLIAGEQSRHKTVLVMGPPDTLLKQLESKFSAQGLTT